MMKAGPYRPSEWRPSWKRACRSARRRPQALPTCGMIPHPVGEAGARQTGPWGKAVQIVAASLLGSPRPMHRPGRRRKRIRLGRNQRLTRMAARTRQQATRVLPPRSRKRYNPPAPTNRAKGAIVVVAGGGVAEDGVVGRPGPMTRAARAGGGPRLAARRRPRIDRRPARSDGCGVGRVPAGERISLLAHGEKDGETGEDR